MKALLMEEYKKLKYTDFPDPKIEGSHDLLVRIKAVAICGSDVHGFDGSTGRRKPPIVMGHEAAGEIIETGSDVHHFRKGDRITFDSTISCGECYYCSNGQVNLCDHRMVLGVSCDEYRRHGCFAEYVVIPERIAVLLPQGLSYEEAACTEPVGVAAHAIRNTPIAMNDTVAVVGSGLIGNLAIQLLKISVSGKIIALDTDPSRREVAKSFGADAVLDPADPELDKKIKELTGGRGADRVIEAVGATAPIRTAISIVRKGGSVTLVGNVSPSVDIPLQAVVSREIRLQGSCAISGEYPIALDLMGRKRIDVKPLISAKAPLSEGEIWMNKLYNREGNLLKVVLLP
ncbi:zinc-dependent alcohol dehydrogenase [Leadbettera azotonutricia]|uniref:Sorbitol dehydrogenase (L-iditol 2-dehydrogenase)(Glucitol dehydrogenase) n=1 Tax=Leadbettera azotonutricia (strain ATCC BAA-888 / DSM 13862 / ZAS-9) TaxID=545695 RepID=F5YED2_LEAAZ|nr:galactitol-1-phosphate 5-dehydrogenase [Leadbettera azotonutricia]AEF80938.1 sorbitol dehydrogenase (L-iditol 2-dehydrogenase)(Glucitol dehydrogenase) [Leadbettera azotonutricia ZAS-9]